MKLRLLLKGIGISAVMPWFVYFIALGLQARMQSQQSDFQYHDSYFLVLNVGWKGYAIGFAVCFVLLAIGYALYMAAKKVKS